MHSLGRLYADDGNYQMASKWYKKSASKGHVEAQFDLGMLYYEGKGVLQNYEEAFKWIKMASEAGFQKAFGILAQMLRKGIGVEKNIPEVFKVCEKGLEYLTFEPVRCVMDILQNEKGYSDRIQAMVWGRRILDENMGPVVDVVADMYLNNMYGLDDPEMTLEVLEQGSYLNNARCHYLLAEYIRNHDTEYSESEAFELEMKSAEQGLAEAQYAVYRHLRNYSVQDAIYWLRRSAAGGCAIAMSALGYEYIAGDTVPRSVNRAIKWLGKAYEAGETCVMNDLEELLYGTVYQEEYGNDVDYDIRLAVEDGVIELYSYIGDHYMNEDNEDFDMEIGMKWYRRGAELGDARCMDRLGFALYYGLAGEPDYSKAFRYISEAACNGMPTSQYLMGMCYLEGRGIGKDSGRARKWLECAAEKGHLEAKKRLKEVSPVSDDEAMKGLEALFA